MSATRRALHAAAISASIYFVILGYSLLDDGTLEWAYPDDECAATVRVVAGVATYPDCPTVARTGWAQYATNAPLRILAGLWPSEALRPQELRAPPRGEAKPSWSAIGWVAVGAACYGLLGAFSTALACVALRLAVRARRFVSGDATTAANRIRRSRACIRHAATLLTVSAGVLIVRQVSLAQLPREPTIIVDDPPRMRAITGGPKFHFFGYYDKFQLDPTDRYALGLEVKFDGRDVRVGDIAEVGMVDLDRASRWIPLGESRAWNWQQGCMLQWLPGMHDQLADRETDDARRAFLGRPGPTFQPRS